MSVAEEIFHSWHLVQKDGKRRPVFTAGLTQKMWHDFVAHLF